MEYTDSCQELQKLFSTTRRENNKQKKASELLTLAFFTGGGDFIYLPEWYLDSIQTARWNNFPGFLLRHQHRFHRRHQQKF